MRRILEDLVDGVKRKRRESVALAILLAIALVLALAVIGPLSRHVEILEAEVSSLETRAAKAHADYEARRELAGSVHDALRSCARFRNTVAGTKEERYVPFKKAVEAVVGLGGQGARSIGFRSSKTKTGLLQQAAQLEIEAAYPRVRQVLGELMGSPQFLIVDRISLTASKGRTPKAQLSVSTVFTTARVEEPPDPLEGEAAPAGTDGAPPAASPASPRGDERPPLIAPRGPRESADGSGAARGGPAPPAMEAGRA